MQWWEYLYNPEFFSLEAGLIKYAQLSWIIPGSLGLLLGRLRRSVHRRILLFVCYTVLMEYVSTLPGATGFLGIRGNYPIYHVLTPGLFAVLYHVFGPVLISEQRRYLRWLPPLIFVFIALGNYAYLGTLAVFPTVTAGLYALSGIVLCLAYLGYLLRTLTVERLELDPLFWFAAAGLIYYSGSVLMLAAINFLNFDIDLFDSVFAVARVLTLLFTAGLSIALIVPPAESAANSTVLTTATP